ncbi:MAG: AIR synthase-related protein, partial [Gaiellaceae bacterium]
ALVRFLWRFAPRLSAAHDAAEGGLAVALAELALWAGVGAELELEDDAVTWFGEGGGQVVVACAPDDAENLEGIALRRIGVVGGSRLLGVRLDELREAYGGGRA